MKQLKDMSPGSIIPFGGMDWILLAVNGNSTLLVAANSIGYMPFDRANSNNWTSSSLRKFLNGDFLETLKSNGADLNVITKVNVSLVDDDGLDDYGYTQDKVSLLSCELYRRYRRVITNLDDCWWLLTPYSTEENGYSYSVRRVFFSDGALNSYTAANGSSGVRPALTLKSDYLVSDYLVSDYLVSDESNLSKYSPAELLNELLKRDNHEHK